MNSININTLIDGAKFNRFHGLVLFWVTFIIVFDGYDLVVFGTITPSLMKEWGVNPVEVGSLASYALFGVMIGALIFGPIADRIGRKNVIMICTFLFSVFTIMSGFAKTTTDFGIYRFLCGVGFGGVMPNCVAIITDYAPKKLKSSLVTIMFSGYCVGGVISAYAGILLIPEFGWRTLFFIGGLPLVLLPFVYKFLPDSIGFLLAKGKTKQVGYLLSRVNPSYTVNEKDQYEILIPAKTGNTVAQLFHDRRGFATIMLWISFIMCLLMTYGLNTWLPKIMQQAGYEMGSSLMFLLVLNFGAIFGAIFGGKAADRFGPKNVLIIFFSVAAICLTLLGFKFNIFVLYLLVAIAGATTTGTSIIANAFASQFYPIQIRSTGVGWATGVGRIGAICGPIMGGYLLMMALPVQQYFIAYAIPGAIGAITIAFVKQRKASNKAVDKNDMSIA